MKSPYAGHYELFADHWLLTGICLKCGWRTRTAAVTDEEDVESVIAMTHQHLQKEHGIARRWLKLRKAIKKQRKQGLTDEQLRRWYYGERDPDRWHRIT